MSKLKKCKTCGADIASSAKVCPSCGAKNKPPIYKRGWFWIVIAFIVIGIAITPTESNTSSSSDTTTSKSVSSAEQTDNQVKEEPASSKNSAFEGDCGISVSAEMGASIIDYPELTISVTNTTDKVISAVQFYAIPYDVYGDEITGWTSQNNLYTDTSINPNASTSISYQFIEDSVKTVKLYIYSVYFADGTEWGNKDATKSTILENGIPVEVYGES